MQLVATINGVGDVFTPTHGTHKVTLTVGTSTVFAEYVPITVINDSIGICDADGEEFNPITGSGTVYAENQKVHRLLDQGADGDAIYELHTTDATTVWVGD